MTEGFIINYIITGFFSSINFNFNILENIMGEFDFTYSLPDNFQKRVIQFLQQSGRAKVVEAFQRCKYEYEDVGLAYYAGLRGDNWNKRAVDFTFEGPNDDVSLLKSEESTLIDAIGKSLKPSVSGYLVRNMFYFDTDATLEGKKIPSSNEERLNVDIETANMVLNDLIIVGERVCLNCTYNASSLENSINDYFRDMLFGMGYKEVKDQTRHGISTTGKDAAEIDMLLTKGGKEIAIFEGLKLDSIKSDYIDDHIRKSIINYNALGTATFIVAYVFSADFEAFWDRYFNYIQKYSFSLKIKKSLSNLSYPNAATRVAMVILTRDGFDFPVYFVAFKIS